ncbi:MAG: DUF4271 domain-containing protein [Bacteroidota bacterium]|nr:DUF4271 domain-containing protein [Bacteroidota bacterium]
MVISVVAQTSENPIVLNDTSKAWYDDFYQNRAEIIESRLIESLSVYNVTDSTFIDSTQLDTIYYETFVGYHLGTYINSKRNLRKSLLASKNPPLRKNINNHYVFFASLWVLFLIIQLKRIFPIQYSLLIRSSYNQIKFLEFLDTQGQVFTLTRLLTWLIISQILGIGIYAVVDYREIINNIHPLYLLFLSTAFVILIFAINQLFKNIFSYAFNQPALRSDYAIIFRIHAFVFSIILFLCMLIMYYQFPQSIKNGMIFIIVLYLLIVYILSVIKFLFSRQFLKSGSILILILYLCSFEILPLVVFVVSLLRFLKI